MTARPVILRSTLLLLIGAFGVHKLRYLLATGQSAGNSLSEHWHGYPALLPHAIGVLTAVVLSVVLIRTAAAPARRAIHIRVRRLWPIASASLFALYGGQEVLQGLLTHGHPPGMESVIGAGGWIAIPISIVLGAVVAFAVRLTNLLEERTFGPGVRVGLRLLADDKVLVLLAPAVVLPSAPSRLLAGRGPPLG